MRKKDRLTNKLSSKFNPLQRIYKQTYDKPWSVKDTYDKTVGGIGAAMVGGPGRKKGRRG